MSFVTALALAVAMLVVAPYVAHRLRRRKADEQVFPAARLVPPAAPKARRRSRLEERALFATRALSVLLLAVLGATPLVRCSRLSLQRSGGASVALALVIDDSMSMRAAAPSGASRFERAQIGARELLASARDGDAIAIVLAGSPARVVLAATTDLSTARAALDAIVPSDRATDLEGALTLAQGLIASLPQVDRRIVVLSDLADGHHDSAPLGESCPVPIWMALPEIAAPAVDCAVVRADHSGARVRVTVACSPGAPPGGRDVAVEDAAGKTLGRVTTDGSSGNATVLLATDDAAPRTARLLAADAIAEDDVAPVVPEARRGAVAVVADPADETVVTGGAPVVEQALAALKSDVDVRPIPAFPDRVEDLAGHSGVLLDDPPGLTPEQRRALEAFVDGGGIVLVALGPHAAAAPLGASLEPLLARPVSWKDTRAIGADPTTALGQLSEPARSLEDSAAPKRATLDPQDASAFDAVIRWADGAVLVGKRAMGRGEAWIVTLPFSIDASDLPLRPAFLSLLDAWVGAARERIAPKRTDVGATWRFAGARAVEVRGPKGPIAVTRDDTGSHAIPPLLGVYEVAVDGKTEVRVAGPDVRELDLRPRGVAASSQGGNVGARRAAVDVSGPIALALLALVAAEMALRLWSRRKIEAT